PLCQALRSPTGNVISRTRAPRWRATSSDRSQAKRFWTPAPPLEEKQDISRKRWRIVDCWWRAIEIARAPNCSGKTLLDLVSQLRESSNMIGKQLGSRQRSAQPHHSTESWSMRPAVIPE